MDWGPGQVKGSISGAEEQGSGRLAAQELVRESSSEDGRLGMLRSASSKLRVGEWGGDKVSGVEKLKKLRSESPGALMPPLAGTGGREGHARC